MGCGASMQPSEDASEALWPSDHDSPGGISRKAGLNRCSSEGAYVRKRKSKAQRGNTIRVFLSSTFKDFGLERDYLNSFIFPEIKKMCRQRGVFFIPVDLRWGVTAEESGRGDVIKLCLEEIDACHPWFVGMVGNRYGWHRPPPNSTEKYYAEYKEDPLLNSTFETGEKYFPWVAEHPSASVTELELRHVINNAHNTEEQIYASFYLRDTESFLAKEAVPEDRHWVYGAESEYSTEQQLRVREMLRSNGR